MVSIFILSDIHYAGDAERKRGATELKVIQQPALRLFVRLYRHYLWKRHPLEQNHLLDAFVAASEEPDYVVANGDYSCDTAFVGVCDDAARESVRLCLDKLRTRFGARLWPILGDHELGKTSLFGGCGGMRLQSLVQSEKALGLQLFWKLPLGQYLLLGVTSSLIALPVFEPEILAEERDGWVAARESHMARIRESLATLEPGQRVILFCHDPTALPFLWRDDAIRPYVSRIEMTVIGHLHSPLFMWKSRLLSGIPPIRGCGQAIRRMSTALHDGRLWRPFRVRLCPALGGIELLKDGGYCRMRLDPSGHQSLEWRTARLSQARRGSK